MNVVRFLRVLAVASAAFFLDTVILPALQAAPAPATAHVRLWKTTLQSLAEMHVSLKTGGGRHTVAHEIGGGGPGFLFSSYTGVPAGHGMLEVFAGDQKNALASLSADLTPGGFVTVLVSESEKAGSPPRIEVIDDGSAAGSTAPSQITVRNFVGDLKDVRVTAGDSLNAQFASGDGFLQMRGLKPAFYPVRTVGTGADGKRFEWNNEADLRLHRSQTLLIYPDPYGRIRPRVIVDGENEADQPVDKNNQNGQR